MATADTISDAPRFDFDPETGTILRQKSKTLPPSGSVRSTKSLGGISIFVDPDAGAAMPRDEEITFTMYEKASLSSAGGAGSAIGVPLEQQNGGSVTSGLNGSERESTIDDSDVNSFMAASSGFEGETKQPAKKSKHEDFTFTYSPSLVAKGIGGSSVKRSSSDTHTQSQRSSAALSVSSQSKKPRAGSFQFQSAYGLSHLPQREPKRRERRESNQSNRSSHIGSELSLGRSSMGTPSVVTKSTTYTAQSNGAVDGEAALITNGFDGSSSESHVTTTRTTVEISKVTTTSQNGTMKSREETLLTNGYDTMKSDVTNASSKISGSTVENGDTRQGASYESTAYQNEFELDVNHITADSGSKPSDYKRMESDLTSVSSMESSALIDSWDKRKTTSSQPVSRSESQKSVRSMSKAPSLQSINEGKSGVVVTDINIDHGDEDDANRGPGSYSFQNLYNVNVGSMERQSKTESERSYGSAPRRKRVAKTDSVSSIASSASRKADAPKEPEMTRSESQGSIMQNQEFRNKMASLMGGGSAGLKSSKASSSVNSSAASSMARRKREPSYRSETRLDISSDSAFTDKASSSQRKDSGSFEIHSSTFPRGSQSDKPVKSEIRSATHEVSETIKAGTVGTLVKDKFKNLNLTGRSLSQSASVVSPSATQSEVDPTETPKFKFSVEGIDTPAADEVITIETAERVEKEGEHEQERGSGDEEEQEEKEDDSTLTRKREFTKGGFSYVRDDKLTSEILKRASDVTARKPHESLERKQSDHHTEYTTEENVTLVDAKSKLRTDAPPKEEKQSMEDLDARSALLLQIRSRLVSPPTVEKSSTAYTEETTTTTTTTTTTYEDRDRIESPEEHSFRSSAYVFGRGDNKEEAGSHISSRDGNSHVATTSVEVHHSSQPAMTSYRADESLEFANEKVESTYTSKSHIIREGGERDFGVTKPLTSMTEDLKDKPLTSYVYQSMVQTNREDESVPFANDTLEFKKRHSQESRKSSDTGSSSRYVITTSHDVTTTSHDQSRVRRDTDPTGYDEAANFTEIATITTDTTETQRHEAPTKTIFEMGIPFETSLKTTTPQPKEDNESHVTTYSHMVTDSHVSQDDEPTESRDTTETLITSGQYEFGSSQPENVGSTEETVITSDTKNFTEERIKIAEEPEVPPTPPPLPDQPPPPIMITSPDNVLREEDVVSVTSSSSDDDGTRHKQINELHLSQQKLVYDGSSYEFKEQEEGDRQEPIETDRLSNIYNSTSHLAVAEDVVQSQRAEDRDKRRSADLVADTMSSSIVATSLRDVNRNSYTSSQQRHIDPPSYDQLSAASEPLENDTSHFLNSEELRHHHHSRNVIEPLPKTTTVQSHNRRREEAINSYVGEDDDNSGRNDRAYTFEEDHSTINPQLTVHTKRRTGGQGYTGRRHRHRQEERDRDRHSGGDRYSVSSASTVRREEQHNGSGATAAAEYTVAGTGGELYIELSGAAADNNNKAGGGRGETYTHASRRKRGYMPRQGKIDHSGREHSLRSQSSSALSSPRGGGGEHLHGDRTGFRIETVGTRNLPNPRSYSEPKYIEIPVIDIASEPESPRSGLLLVKSGRSPPVSPRYRGNQSHQRRSRRDIPRHAANPRYRALSNPPNKNEYTWYKEPIYRSQSKEPVYRSNSSSTIGSTQSVPVYHASRDPYVVDKRSGHHVRYRVSPRSPSSRSPVYSPRSPVYSPRSPTGLPPSGRSKTVVQLSPTHAAPAGHLATHLSPSRPFNYHSSSASSIMTSPGVMSSDIDVFDTSNMNGVSTMGRRIVLDNSKDENMNYKKSHRERVIRVDESRGGRLPVGVNRGMHISTINIEGPDDSFDAHSTVSDSAVGRRSRVKNIMERRNMPLAARPTNVNTQRATNHSSTHHKYFSVAREPTVHIQKTEEVELDPHLDEAHKTGDKYNVSLKLNANVVNSNETSMLQQEYVEENLYSTSSHDRHSQQVRATSQGPLMSPRGGREGGSVSSGSTLHSPAAPGNRSKTNITFYDDDNEGTLRAQPANTVDHLRFKQYVDRPPQIIASHHQQSGYYSDHTNEKYVIKSNIGSANDNSHHHNKMRYHSSNSSNGGGEAPKFSMSIDQTMTMDYVPTDDQPEPPIIKPQRVAKHKTPRRKGPKDERMDYRIVNGDVGHSRRRVHEEDLEQYLSPAEDHDYESGGDEDMPQVVRGSMLIKNAIDTTGAAKVIDVVEDESGSEPDVTDNVNPFHGHYLQSRENPMYSSDPDLSRRHHTHVTHSKQRNSTKQQPGFTKMFEEKVERVEHAPKKKQVNGAFAELERQRYDTEIKVTRGNSTKSPRRSTSDRSETYHYNGYEMPQRSSSNHVTSSSSSRHMTSASAGGSGGGGGGAGSSRHNRSSHSEFEISRLLKDAPPNSIRQTINVEREEEQIIGPLMEGNEDIESMLNFDTISEKVDLGMKEGTAQVSVKVRCERIVPILGVTDMFKKSSVIVTRLIEIDLLITDERRRLYDHITKRASGKQMITENGERHPRHYGHLTNKETFKLYKTFMGMAEADEAGKSRDNIRIDRRVEEQSRPEAEADGMDMDLADADDDDLGFNTDDLDQRLEEQMIQYAMRHAPEPDTISFMSALSETEGMMY